MNHHSLVRAARSLAGPSCAAAVLAFVLTTGCTEEAATPPDAPAADGFGQLAEPLGLSSALGLSVIAAPHPVKTTDERGHLVYETIIRNVGSSAVSLQRLDVFAPERRAPLLTYTRDTAPDVLFPLDGDSADPLLEGAGAIVFVDVPLPPKGASLGTEPSTPAWLRERIVSTDSGGVQHVSLLKVPVIRDRPIRIGPPLLRQRLLDLNGCCAGAHTRAAIQQPDGLFVSQRFAIDFVQLGEGAATFSGDPSRNESYFLYGADVLAVSAGRIVDVRDGIDQNVPGEPLPAAQLDTAAGNYVIEELDDGHFALYAHLQPGSQRVVAGDHVSRGEVLGLVGNSGNSTEPHLHFQIMDRGSPFDADGLPYLFERFQLLGRMDLSSPELTFTKTAGSPLRSQRLPLAGDVIGF